MPACTPVLKETKELVKKINRRAFKIIKKSSRNMADRKVSVQSGFDVGGYSHKTHLTDHEPLKPNGGFGVTLCVKMCNIMRY